MADDFTDHKLAGCLFDPEHAAELIAEQPIQSYQALPRESGLGKKRYLWEFQRKVMGKDFTELQTEGTCASKAPQRAIVLLGCVRIALNGMNELPPLVPSSEVIYALGRIEIGRGKLGRDNGRSGGGLVLSWGLQALMKWGVLPRGHYGSIDLTKPDDRLAVAWGQPGVGCPDSLEAIALSTHMPIKAFAPIRSWEEGCTAMYNGEPIMFGSNDLPNPNRATRRDANGFYVCDARGGHARIYSGYDDTEDWWYEDNGSWPAAGGPNPVNGPVCGGKIHRDRIEARFDQGEVYALSDITGMPNQAEQLDFVLD